MPSHEAKPHYEQLRQARISENQARLASIGLSKTLLELRSLGSSQKPQVRKLCKIDYSSRPLRRSARLTGGDPLPSQDYGLFALEKRIRKEKRASGALIAPKKPLAYLVFFEHFAKQYKRKRGEPFVKVIRACGVKWKSMSDEERAPFVAETEKREEKYEREMEAYLKIMAADDVDESDFSESEYHERRATMATDELNKPTLLPPYPQIIMEAIDALKQTEGAKESSISKYMESEYGEMLPADHTNLLSDHLNQLKDSGELSFVNNNYLKPSGVQMLPDGITLSPPRPRGGPRKNSDAPSVSKMTKACRPEPQPMQSER